MAQKNKKTGVVVSIKMPWVLSQKYLFKFHVIEKTSKWPIRHNSILALKDE